MWSSLEISCGAWLSNICGVSITNICDLCLRKVTNISTRCQISNMCPALGLRSKSTSFFVTSPKNETINFNEIFLLILSRNFCWQYDMKIERGNVQLSLHSVHVDLTISSISILINFYLGKLSPQLFDDQAVEYSFANMACFEISSIILWTLFA